MSDLNAKLYEGLFLVDQGAVASDMAGTLAHVQEMFDRAEAQVLALGKWDERRLAHPVKNQKRGTYLLSLFRVNPLRIVNIERDCNLSERVLRVMFTNADHFGETEIQAAVEDARTSADEAKLREQAESSQGNAEAADQSVQPASTQGDEQAAQPVSAAAAEDDGGGDAEKSAEA